MSAGPARLNLAFDEPFFDAVFSRMGWKRVPRLQGNLPGGETVDYVGDGYALELKHLSTNSYEAEGPEANNRKLKLLEFQTEQYLAGTLVVDWVNGIAGPTPGKREELSRLIWQRHLGNSLRNAMMTANGQIAQSLKRQSCTQQPRCAVLVINEVFPVVDTVSLANLMVAYLTERDAADLTKRRLESTHVGYGLCTHLEEIDLPEKGHRVQALACAGPMAPTAEDLALQDKLQAAITAEVRARTNLVSQPIGLDSAALRPQRRSQKVKIGSSPMTITMDGCADELEPGFSGIIGRTWARAKAHADAEKGHETRNCHYVPRFLLARWRGPDGKLQVQDPATGVITPKDSREVAVRTDLYSLLQPSGILERRFLEKFFQLIESAAARILAAPLMFKRDDRPGSVPEFLVNARQILALFTAIQTVRLPTVLVALAQEWRTDWKAEWGLAEDRLPHPGNFLYRLLGGAEPLAAHGEWFAALAQVLHDKRWAYLHYAEAGHRIQTGEILLRIAVRGGNPISTDPKDWAIQMPLGPEALLALGEVSPDGQPLAEGYHRLDPAGPPWVWSAPGLRERIL